jgi:short-subunit dehydrogenase
MKNKLILITGGSSGIGKAAATELYNQGAKIILQARNLENLKATASAIDPSGERVSYYSTDLTTQESVAAGAKLIIEKEGLPDVIVNSAGAGEWLSFKEAPLSHFKETMDSPYIATALTCKVFYDAMQERGTGHFIIVNSAACFFSFKGTTGYTPARWAMLGFTKSLQTDLYNTNFKVSMVALGKVDSPYFTNNPRSESRIPRIANILIPTMTVASAGKAISTTIKRKKSVVIKPFMMALFIFMNRFIPGLFRWLIRVTDPK